MTAHPAPLVPPEVDLRDFPFMPLHVAQLLDSETWLLATGDEAKAAVTLWCKAWHQKPAASLPNDDRILASMSGAGTKWKKVRDIALRGFVLCADGRLYHRTIAENALESWAKKVAQRERTKAATEARQAKRKAKAVGDAGNERGTDEKRNDGRNEQRGGERNVHQETGTGTETGNLDDADEGARRRDPIREVLDSIGAWSDPNLHIHGARVLDWLRQGADLDADIIPIVQSVLAKARRGRSDATFMPSSLNFFDRAIADAIAARTRPLPAATITGADHAASRQQTTGNRQPYDPDESRRRTAQGYALAVEREERDG